MNLGFPLREPLVVRNRELRVVRRFPGGGEVKARGGQRVGAEASLGTSDPMASAVHLNISEMLGLAAKDVAKHLVKPVGSTVTTGETLAKTRRGFRTVAVTAPVSATVADLDTASGVVSLVPAGAGAVLALVPGDVEFVAGRDAVMIRTVGDRISGVVGLGPAVRGPLHIAVSDPAEDLSERAISADVNGAIVVGGTYASAAALAKLAERGAVAVITGGLVEREVASFLGWKSDDRLAGWRPDDGDGVVAGGSPAPLSMMATEGFGVLAINAVAWAALTDLNGRIATLLPTTRLSTPLTRPELIVPNEAGLDDDAHSDEVRYLPGTMVRFADQANLGKMGTVSVEPRRRRIADSFVTEVVDVTMALGGTRTVPVSTIEVLGSHQSVD